MTEVKKGRLSLKLGRRKPSFPLPHNSRHEKGSTNSKEEGDSESASPGLCAGLENLGNTCYCNAVLQVLRHSPCSLQRLRRRWRTLDPRPEQKQLEEEEKESLMQALTRVVMEMEESMGAVNPAAFVKLLRQSSSQFAGTGQHDAQELLHFLLVEASTTHTPTLNCDEHTHTLDCDPHTHTLDSDEDTHTLDCDPHTHTLDSDEHTHTLTVGCKRKALTLSKVVQSKLVKTDSMNIVTLENHSWSSRKDQSSLSALFEGRLSFTTRCLQCESCTSRAESFLHISVPVTGSGFPGFASAPPTSSPHHHQTHSSAAPISLSWALSLFASQERLCGNNKYWCSNCKHLEEAERTIRFSTLPQILTVHLNRFTAHSWGEAVGKVNGNIAVPLTLCLKPWCSRECPNNSTCYQLQAAILHSGTSCHSGHYIAVVRSTDHWILCDDESIQHLTEGELQQLLSPLSSSAASVYILFYCINR